MAIDLFGGVRIEGGTSELQDLLKMRSDFIESYCKAKGWKIPLTIEQVLEIRSQDGWKNLMAKAEGTK